MKKITLSAITVIAGFSLLFFSPHKSFAQGWKKTVTKDALVTEDKNQGTNVKVGINVANPTKQLEVRGPVALQSNVAIDSAITLGANYRLDGKTGSFKNNAWTGAFLRLMYVDIAGNVAPFAMSNNSSQYLSGTGQWLNFPALPYTISGSNTNFAGGISAGTLTVTGSSIFNGSITNTSLAGIGNRMLFADATGVINFLPAGNNSQVLFASGVWGDLPAPPNVYWNTAGSGIFYNGNVGINTQPSSLYALDINGSTHISSNLYVDGFILIGNKADINTVIADTATAQHVAAKTVAAKTLTAIDSISAATMSAGAVRTDTLRSGNIILPSAVQKLSVNGGASFNGTLTANALSVPTLDLNQALTFNGGQARIGYIPANTSGNTNSIFTYGKQIGSQLPLFPCTSTPYLNSAVSHQFQGIIQAYGNSVNGNHLNVLTMGYDGANGTIDLEGTTSSGDPALLLNYYCGKDVAICNNFSNGGGSNGKGGVVSVGQNFQIGGTALDLNTSLNLKAWGTTAINVQGLGNNSVFKIASDGSTLINANSTNTIDAFVINDIVSNSPIANFKIKTTGQVYAREVIVKLSAFPDYVFKKGYKLMPLPDVENYFLTNQHLKNMPSAKEVEKNGANLGEIQRVSVEKIEDIYLYIIDINKRVEKIEKENKEFKKENADLKEEIKKLKSN